jgi:aminoglycoside phosphotransferase (APT) family kinase protein
MNTVPFESVTAEIACELLADAGFGFAATDVQIEARDERWLVRLPGQQLAWFAASTNGHERLQTERRVLRLLAARCTFQVPRVCFESATGDFDVRAMVPGACDPWRLFAELRESVELGMQLGTAIGTLLAQQHTRIHHVDVDGWLPRTPAWPEPREWIRSRLGAVVSDPPLVADAAAIMDAYENTAVSEADRALVHTDVGFHNLAVDPVSHIIHGIFDYDGAAWADRHHDFRYLVFDLDRYELLEAAIAAYEPVTGHRIDRGRVLLYNAACAITYLAYRAGTAPEDRSCGRTLAEDLRWSTHAIARALQ